MSVIGDRSRMIRLVKNMLVSLTFAHCFEDVRIVGIFVKRRESSGRRSAGCPICGMKTASSVSWLLTGTARTGSAIC